MINLKYTYQPSHSLDEVNTQVTNLVELLKNELLQAATNENVEAVTLKVEQTSDDGLQRIAQVQAAVGDTAAKVGMLATYNQASGSITVSAALVNGIEQSDIVLSGDQITLNGNVTIANNFKLTGDHITANTITSTQIATGTITANEIAGNTITAAEIATGAITSDEIASRTITAGDIAVGAITANEIAAHTITAAEISTNYVYAGTIEANQINVADLRSFGATIGGFEIGTNYIKGNSNQGLKIYFGNSYLYEGQAYDPGDYQWRDAMGIYPNAMTGKIYAEKLNLSNPTAAQSSTANLRISDAGNICKITSGGSSKRYKHDITKNINEEMDPKKLYDIDVVQFVFNDDYIDKNDQRARTPVIGMIAEDVREKYPVACDVNEDGTAETWSERFIIPPMLALIQEQNERIKRLEARYGE